MPPLDIALTSVVEDLVNAYNESERIITQAFNAIDGTLRKLNHIYVGADESLMLSLEDPYGHHRISYSEPAVALKELRRCAWIQIIRKTKIQTVMSVRAWKDFDYKMRHEDPPPISVEIIHGMLGGFQSQAEDMLREAVKEVFNILRPPHSKFKTNTEFEIGERVVLTGCLDKGWSSWTVSHYRQQELVALENVLRLMDSKPKLETVTSYSDLDTQIRSIPIKQPCKGETEYMEFKGFHNGNLHLKFKRMSLIDRLNAIAGGANLKPTTKEAA